MKIITLNESQFRRLFEDGGRLNGDDTTAYIGNKETTIGGAAITTPDGGEEMSDSPTSKEYSSMLSDPHGWFYQR